MALSEDSRSLLQLLLVRGKSYGDIADLLGADRSEVRHRAHAALTEIHGGDPDRNANLTDYLLGQADPIERAEVARALADDPGTRATALELSDQLRLLIPGAGLPTLQPSAGTIAARPARERSRQAGSKPGFRPNLTVSQRRLLAMLVAGALLIGIVAIFVFTGVIGGSGSSETATPAATTAVLRPVAGESGDGKVEFGFSGTSLAANLQFNDLKPSAKGDSYALWLYGPGGAFPLNQTRVTDSGAIAGQIAINEAIICFIAGDLFPDMRLSRVTNSEMRQTLRKARDSKGEGAKGGLPDFVGDLVLEGQISMPQAAKDRILRTCKGPQ